MIEENLASLGSLGMWHAATRSVPRVVAGHLERVEGLATREADTINLAELEQVIEADNQACLACLARTDQRYQARIGTTDQDAGIDKTERRTVGQSDTKRGLGFDTLFGLLDLGGFAVMRAINEFESLDAFTRLGDTTVRV